MSRTLKNQKMHLIFGKTSAENRLLENLVKNNEFLFKLYPIYFTLLEIFRIF